MYMKSKRVKNQGPVRAPKKELENPPPAFQLNRHTVMVITHYSEAYNMKVFYGVTVRGNMIENVAQISQFGLARYIGANEVASLN